MNELIQTLHTWLTDYQKLEVLGAVVGLIYIYQEIRASIWLWITGIIMPVIYLFVYYEAGLYADFGMQIYYVLASTYGFIVWKFWRNKQQEELKITRLPRRLYLPLALCFAALWTLLYCILVRFTNSTVPVLDSFGNSLSIIALWVLARKHIEQWLLWIVVDVELAFLYAYKDIPFTAGLYGLYAILAIYGYFQWKKEMRKTV